MLLIFFSFSARSLAKWEKHFCSNIPLWKRLQSHTFYSSDRNWGNFIFLRNKDMVRVNNFLGCFPLETGGICLGWFFFSTFFIITSFIAVFGWMSIVSKRKFSFSPRLSPSWIIFKFNSSTSSLHTCVAWYHHLLDNRRVFLVAHGSRNKNGDLKRYVIDEEDRESRNRVFTNFPFSLYRKVHRTTKIWLKHVTLLVNFP